MPKAQLARKIETHRKLTELRLRDLLDDAVSSVTFEIMRQTIFESGANDFPAFVTAMLAALNCEEASDIGDDVLNAVQDAWNYFPHRELDGRCPAELMFAE